MSNDKSPLPFFSQRLISLWDMVKFETDKITHVFAAIGDAKTSAVHHREHREPGREFEDWPLIRRKETGQSIRNILPIVAEFGLGMTKSDCEQLARDVEHLPISSVITASDHIRDTLEKELKQRKFFVLSTDHNMYYDAVWIKEARLIAKWAQVNQELTGAGNCFALGRYKACVVHCCIGREGGLVALAKRLGVKKQTDWGGWIAAIRNELKGRYTPKKNRAREFYADCAERFDAIRIGQRNPASHYSPNHSYTEEQAKAIFDSTVAFLRLLAAKL
jgi:hypothetical protein